MHSVLHSTKHNSRITSHDERSTTHYLPPTTHELALFYAEQLERIPVMHGFAISAGEVERVDSADGDARHRPSTSAKAH